MEKYKILVWGAGNRAKTILTMLKSSQGQFEYKNKVIKNYEIICLVNSSKKKNISNSIPLIYNKNKFFKILKKVNSFIVTVGGENGYARIKISDTLKKFKLKPISFCSKDFIKDSSVKIGSGYQIMKNVTINSNCKIGNYCILNTSATVDHDCFIEDGTHIMPGSTLAGDIKIGKFSTIGTNSTIIPKVKIGTNVYVGAGAVILKNIKKDQIIVGNPQRILRNNTKKNEFKLFSKL